MGYNPMDFGINSNLKAEEKPKLEDEYQSSHFSKNESEASATGFHKIL
jgi:hypothetical protein